MTSAGCAITCLIVACVDSSFYVPSSFNVWVNILATATICTLIPILLFLQSLVHIDAEKASILSVSQLVFIAIFGVILLHENLANMQIIGITIIVAGTLVALMRDKHTKKSLA